MPETRGFDRALPVVLVYEGGYVNDPRDPGGATMKGVTQRVYDAFRDRKKLPRRPVKQILESEIHDIYKAQYWDAVQGDKLREGVGLVLFDGAVNSGPKQSIKWLQRALGLNADGVLGGVTLQAAMDVADDDALIAKVIARRELFLRSLKTFAHFGKGWMSRITKLKVTGQAWAVGSVGPSHAFIAGAQTKAVIEDAKVPKGKAVADGATGAGIGSGGLSVTVSQLQEQLTPFSMAGDWIGKLVVALAVLSAVLTVGGLAYRWWASRNKAKLADALDAPMMAA